ncbi:hypothetical protein [Uliginosibacterium sp. H1]|uniref:hypothetical protein n=1 Tax=Uliginosibacterium sp. H1 TaxID=3114757 RepID=UPI002E19E897|nr:hypothetical protein [Uliginosibacterium sp. H1]
MTPTPGMVVWLVLDAFGMLLLASGGYWLFYDKALLIEGWPGGTFGAIVCVVLGFGLMLQAVAKLLAASANHTAPPS